MVSAPKKRVLKSANIINTLKSVNVSSFIDNWGPEEVIQLYDPETNMQGVIVIDNTVLGPSIGNIDIKPYVTPLEVFQSARNKTWKSALIDIPLGGANSTIRANPNSQNYDALLDSFAEKLVSLVPWKYIAAPGKNLRNSELEKLSKKLGDLQGVVGKPEKLGGIPRELGTHGVGVGVVIDTLVGEYNEYYSLPNFENIRIAIQDWNIRAYQIAKYLTTRGAKIIAINDKWSTIYDPDGIDINRFEDFLNANHINQSLQQSRDGKVRQMDNILNIDCDILILTDVNNSITTSNWNKIKAKFIVEATDFAVPKLIELKLKKKRNITVIPDLIANTGDLIASYYEYRRKSKNEAFSQIKSRVSNTFKDLLEKSINSDLSPREKAIDIAQKRILEKLEDK